MCQTWVLPSTAVRVIHALPQYFKEVGKATQTGRSVQIKNYSEQVYVRELRGSWGKWTDPLTKVLVLGNIFMWGSALVFRLRRNGKKAVGHFSPGEAEHDVHRGLLWTPSFSIPSSTKRQENSQRLSQGKRAGQQGAICQLFMVAGVLIHCCWRPVAKTLRYHWCPTQLLLQDLLFCLRRRRWRVAFTW